MRWMLLIPCLTLWQCTVANHHGGANAASKIAADVLVESFVSASFVPDNLDSIAIYKDSQRQWAILTAKATDTLFVFDANSGELVKKVGQTGSGDGDLRRPNGIWAGKDFLLVVERDNHRVQAFSLPEFKPMGTLGDGDLIKPYGLTCFRDEKGTYQLYVTDDYDLGPQHPASARVKHYRLDTGHGHIHAEKVREFGALEGPGHLFKVESILADPVHDRLFIAVEKGPDPGIKLYTLEGDFTGRELDTNDFHGEPEGIAIYPTGDRTGFIVTTDQQHPYTVFHIYDRQNLQRRTHFRGQVTANTDGIAVTSWSTDAFQEGGLWAIHDDQALSAFDWRTIQSQIQKGFLK